MQYTFKNASNQPLRLAQMVGNLSINRDTLPFHNNTTIEREKYGNKVRHFIDYTRNIACVEKQSVSNILVRW